MLVHCDELNSPFYSFFTPFSAPWCTFPFSLSPGRERPLSLRNGCWLLALFSPPAHSAGSGLGRWGEGAGASPGAFSLINGHPPPALPLSVVKSSSHHQNGHWHFLENLAEPFTVFLKKGACCVFLFQPAPTPNVVCSFMAEDIYLLPASEVYGPGCL